MANVRNAPNLPGAGSVRPAGEKTAEQKTAERATKWVPGERGAAPEQARQRRSPEAAQPTDAPAQRGVTAARTLEEVKYGVEVRYIRLNNADREVAQLEAKLGTQLANLSPAMTPEELNRYACAFRENHPGAYNEARHAAGELGHYLRDNTPRVHEAIPDLSSHPIRNAVADLPLRFGDAVEYAAKALDRHTHLSPEGDGELQRTLGECGNRFKQLSSAAGEGGDENATRHKTVKDVSTAGEGALSRLAKFGGRFSEIAEHSANAFGIVAGAIGGVENVHRIVSGEARAEHGVGLTANGAEVVGGVLAISGVAVGATIGLAGAIVALGAEGVSIYRDRQDYLRDTTENLLGIGMDKPRAEGLAASNVDSLRAFAGAGFSPQQISDFTANAPDMVRGHVSHAQGVIHAAGVFGLSPSQVTELSRALGSPGAGVAFNSLVRVIAANPNAPRALILQLLNKGFEANDFARDLARRLPAS
jgi:hypothetical protein